METIEFKKYRLKCDCECHEVAVSANWDSYKDKVFSDFSLSFWQLGHHTNKWSWLYRFSMIWQILINGHAYTDMVTLDVDERKRFYEILKEVIEIDEKLKPVN